MSAARAPPGRNGPGGKPFRTGKPGSRQGSHGAKPWKSGKKPQGRPQARHVPDPEPTVDPDAPAVRFEDMDISDATKAAIEAMGFTEATPIQGETIPLLMAGRDVIGQAQTGTGKTAAFGVPLIEAARNGRHGLVLAPTRELAKQVQQELQAISKGSPVEAICIVGGAPFGDQVRALQRHSTAIVVATPGRIVDHLGRGTINLNDVTMFVLDEADEMLSMGFQDELEAIVDALPAERQNVLFSATMAGAVEKLAKKTLVDPVTVRVARGVAPTITQGIAKVAGRDRLEAIQRIIEAEDPTSVLLFARTRARVEELVDHLRAIGAEALHGGMGQPQRESVMGRFRDGKTRLLVATDVAARGLDVDTIELVLHDDLPGDTDTYIHRIGRTGRAGRTGASILLINPGQARKLRFLEEAVGRLESYRVPDDAEIAEARAERMVSDLLDLEPSEAAHAALNKLLASGMDATGLALRLLEQGMKTEVKQKEAAPVRSITSAIALKVGKMDKVHAGSIVAILTNSGGLRAEDVGRIDVLEKMSVAEIPTDEMDRVCAALGNVRLSGRPVMPREAEDWQFKGNRR